MRNATVIASTVLMSLVGASATAQDASVSEALAKQLGQAMEKGKLDCVAAAELDSPDRFVAALSFPGQLLVVSARYPAPRLLRERLLSRDYREVYQQLQGGGEQEGKLFVQDLGMDGLHFRPSPTRPLDIIYQSVNIRTAFDGNWAKQGLTERQYRERFRAADQQYARLLTALLAQVKPEPNR